MTYNIQLNQSGTHRLEVTPEHMHTIARYHLFTDLVDSNGYVTEDVVEKLRLTVRSLISAQDTPDKALLDLAFEVLFHNKMKAYGLHNLIVAFAEAQITED